MGHSKRTKSPARRVVGAFCNAFRVMNNLHPSVPNAFILGVAGPIGRSGYGLVA